MPWKETCPMDQRLQFIGLYLSHEYSMARPCDILNRLHVNQTALLQTQSSPAPYKSALRASTQIHTG